MKVKDYLIKSSEVNEFVPYEMEGNYDWSYLQDHIKDIWEGIYEINEFLAETNNKQGKNQFKKFFQEWKKMEKLIQSYI